MAKHQNQNQPNPVVVQGVAEQPKPPLTVTMTSGTAADELAGPISIDEDTYGSGEKDSTPLSKVLDAIEQALEGGNLTQMSQQLLDWMPTNRADAVKFLATLDRLKAASERVHGMAQEAFWVKFGQR